MNVLGLDYSSAKCGWAVIDLETNALNYNSFSFEDYKKEVHGPNYWGYLLNKIRTETLKILQQYNVGIILMEEIFDRKMQGGGFKTLARAWSAAELVVYEFNPNAVLKYKYASTVRSPYNLSISKKTKADMMAAGMKTAQYEIEKKRIIVDYINKRWNLNLDIKEHDTADAILSASYLYDIEKGTITETLYKGEIKKLKKEEEKAKKLALKEQKIKEREEKAKIKADKKGRSK